MSIAWNRTNGWTVHQIPSSLPPIFTGDRLVVFGLLSPPHGKRADEAGKEINAQARLRGSLGQKSAVIDHVINFSASLAKDLDQSFYGALHCLYAKCLIQEKQDEYHDTSRQWNDGELDAMKDKVISVSKAANVVSKFTSFVAVDKDSHQPVSGPLKKTMVCYYEGIDYSIGSVSSSDDDGCVYYNDAVEEEEITEVAKSSSKKAKTKGFFSSLFGKTPSSPTAVQFSAGDMDLESSAPRAEEFYGGKMPQKKKESPTAMSVISLQRASGSWDLTDQLVSLCGTSRDALLKGCPKEIAVDTDEGKLLWATALALVLLMGKFLDQKDEWEMIGEKGTKWMKKNLPAGVKYENVLEAAATAIGVKIH